MPVFYAFMGDDDIARLQWARCLSRFLIPACAASDEQDLIAICMDMPVIAATRFKGYVGNACRNFCIGDQHL